MDLCITVVREGKKRIVSLACDYTRGLMSKEFRVSRNIEKARDVARGEDLSRRTDVTTKEIKKRKI